MIDVLLALFISTAGASEQAKQDLLNAYSEEVASYGAELDIELQWNNKSKNAHAARWGNTWRIVIGGAFLNWKNGDGPLRLLLCHELGHHLGGSPKKFPGTGDLSWVAAEGQADYFAGHDCALKIMDLETAVRASESLAKHWWHNNRKQRRRPPPSLDKKSTVVVEKTLRKHPEPQCRLDTYIAGITCPTGQDCRPKCWFKSP